MVFGYEANGPVRLVRVLREVPGPLSLGKAADAAASRTSRKVVEAWGETGVPGVAVEDFTSSGRSIGCSATSTASEAGSGPLKRAVLASAPRGDPPGSVLLAGRAV
ncbi:hypothetical protein GCM10009864_62430 [Streptomyces lunalinharesii]|uniref:Uncharacterized protein n=1 Tax=Streptomyces lunalinharesii TaxID=333384 RepID=A0ABN3SMY9_9ACTN